MNTEENTTANERPAAQYRPSLTFYHANAKGTGCAVSFELHPAHGENEGSVWVRFANQLTVGDRRGPNPTYPRFDWEGRIVVRLCFGDLTKMLQVFRGECESIEDGRGLYHASAKANTRIQLRHYVEPVPGYAFEVFRTSLDRKEESHACIVLTPAEALGLSAALENSFGVICFGIPTVIERDTSEYRRAVKEARHAAAAA